MEQNISIWQGFGWKAISDRTKDLVIALVIASIGLIGTYLILGRNLNNDLNENAVSSAEVSNNVFATSTSNAGNPKLTQDALLLIQGNYKPEEMLKVNYMNYQDSKRYLIDYGNGIRNIIHSSSTYIKYQESGIYYVQFYEMVNDKWELISSQAVNIK
ncbi:MAG: hypothetical protein HOP11_10665 [Saprospiraceae bacterium]|nr:hypothetical protein [Saprospiraceae bacterium]